MTEVTGDQQKAVRAAVESIICTKPQVSVQAG